MRFDRSLEEVAALGGGVRLLSWSNSSPKLVPESGADWRDIATMIRDHVGSDNNVGVEINIRPNGRGSNIYQATWIKAKREPREGERGLPEEAMDTLVFRDKSKFFFDRWSDGTPYIQVKRENPPASNTLIRVLQLWFGDPKTRLAKFVVFAGITMIAAPWWQPIIQQFAVEYLNLKEGALQNADNALFWSGWALVILGVGLYIYAKRSPN